MSKHRRSRCHEQSNTVILALITPHDLSLYSHRDIYSLFKEKHRSQSKLHTVHTITASVEQGFSRANHKNLKPTNFRITQSAPSKMVNWIGPLLSPLDALTKYLGLQSPSNTYFYVTKDFTATDRRGLKEHAFKVDSIVDRLDPDKIDDCVWVSLTTKCDSSMETWTGWVPSRYLAACTPGWYRTICKDVRYKGHSRKECRENLLVYIKKVPDKRGEYSVELIPAWEVLYGSLTVFTALWHYVSQDQRTSGTISAQCLTFESPGRPSVVNVPDQTRGPVASATAATQARTTSLTKASNPGIQEIRNDSIIMPCVSSRATQVDDKRDQPMRPPGWLLPDRLYASPTLSASAVASDSIFSEAACHKALPGLHSSGTSMQPTPSLPCGLSEEYRPPSPRAIEATLSLPGTTLSHTYVMSGSTDESIPLQDFYQAVK